MVDNTIALQVRPFQMPDIGQIYGNVQNIQMNRMRMAEAQEMGQERNALRTLAASGVDPYSPEGLAQLRRVAPTLAPQYAQAASQQAYQRAQIDRIRSQNDREAFQTAQTLLVGVRNADDYARLRPTLVERFPQYAEFFRPEYSPELIQRLALGAEGLIRRESEGAAANRPTEFDRVLERAGIRPGTPEYADAYRARAASLTGGRQPRLQVSVVEGMPMITDLDTGESYFTRVVPGAGAPRAPVDLRRPQAAAPTAPAQPTNMMLPNVAAPTLAAGPGAVPPAAAPTTLEEAAAARDVRATRQAGAETGARETATLEARSAAARRQEQEQLARAISELERISAPGGLLERSTGGGLNAIVDRFFDFFNAPTSGAVAIGSLQPVADVVLKMVPRFEGPQSDRDTQSYREAAGRLADPTVPNETRLAAAREILRLFRARQNQFDYNPTTNATPSPGGGQPARTGQAQTQQAFREGQTAVGPNGQRIEFRNGQWVPIR